MAGYRLRRRPARARVRRPRRRRGGLDFSAEFVGRARERASDRGLGDRTEFHVADMRDLGEWSGSYDLITVFWNSLGYYGRETDLQVLADAREAAGRGRRAGRRAVEP
ncbi:class I SAM-dependent methyltransferase [Halosimplex aquaticum]